MQYYLNRASVGGFSKAVWLEDLSIQCKAEMRAYCDSCPNKSHSWVCPPHCGTLDHCQEKANGFSTGLLLQSITELVPPTKNEYYAQLNYEHNMRLKELVDQLKPLVADVLPLTSGGCVFCESCSYPDPCIKPDVKMESLSAYGIDVTELCELAGLPFSFRPDVVYFTALLLLRQQ
jgi:predicted metal-binding protein